MTAIPAEIKAAHESILPFARTVARRLDTLYEFSICFGEALVCPLSGHEIVQVHMDRGQTNFATHRYGHGEEMELQSKIHTKLPICRPYHHYRLLRRVHTGLSDFVHHSQIDRVLVLYNMKSPKWRNRNPSQIPELTNFYEPYFHR
jgi:hypothetical protein